MNVGELKAILEDLDDNVEVRLMSQPNRPFEYEIRSNTVLATDMLYPGEEEVFIPQGYERTSQPEDCELSEIDGDVGDVLYLVEGKQLGYGSKDAWY